MSQVRGYGSEAGAVKSRPSRHINHAHDTPARRSSPWFMSRVRLSPLRPDLAQLKVHAGSESARHAPKPQRKLNGTEDIALPPGEWGWHPRMSRRLGLYRLVQLPGTHEVIFSDPNGLADKIIEAGRD